MYRRILAALALAGLLAACGSQAAAPLPTAAPAAPQPTAAPAAPAGARTLTLMAHDSFSVSEDVLKAFEQQNNVKVEVLKSGDAGQALNKATLSAGSPLADVFFGVDNTFLTRALKAGIFEPYNAAALASIPAEYKLDPSNSLVPIDYGYVSVNYDKAYLAQNKLAPPATLEDLAKPEWKGKLVVENAATSSPGLAFMLATIGHFGASGSYTWLDYWKALRANDVLVVDGWSDAYNTQFSGSSGKGPRPLVVSYASSPPAEVFFSEGKLTDAPTGVMAGGSFLQVEFAGILKGTKNRDLAEKLIDFMLGKRFQEDMPLQMFVYPVVPGSALPDLFTKFAAVPAEPVRVAPEQIDQNREQWVDAWTKTVLR
ncbi:thiamine ABC transporter substrate binding subunit [Kouleothrix sp.]|uniref:thiamine ABC transporter substrate-binding protein n=1 Tax=Kouleothrix sp. TaxID=2779161 RepID=UPI00391D5D7A